MLSTLKKEERPPRVASPLLYENSGCLLRQYHVPPIIITTEVRVRQAAADRLQSGDNRRQLKQHPHLTEVRGAQRTPGGTKDEEWVTGQEVTCAKGRLCRSTTDSSSPGCDKSADAARVRERLKIDMFHHVESDLSSSRMYSAPSSLAAIGRVRPSPTPRRCVAGSSLVKTTFAGDAWPAASSGTGCLLRVAEMQRMFYDGDLSSRRGILDGSLLPTLRPDVRQSP